MIFSDTAFLLHKKVQSEGIEKDLPLFGVALLRLNDYVCLSKHLHPRGRMEDDQKEGIWFDEGGFCSG